MSSVNHEKGGASGYRAVVAAAMVLCCLFVASGYAGLLNHNSPDYYMVTATAPYRPVSLPGTQRRVAQNDAEAIARRQILEYVGSMPLGGGKKVNDVMAQDSRLRTEILSLVRNSDVYDWKVCRNCCEVQVWVRLDLNCVRAALARSY